MKRYLFLFFAFIAIILLATPSLWAYYLWTTFPEASADRVARIEAEFGIGRDCSGSSLNISEPNRQEIMACFSNSSEEQIILDDKNVGLESVTRTYRCEGEGFSGEIVYTFYATTERYLCRYKISDTWESIPKYQTGDLAGFSPDPSYLTKVLIRIFN